MKEVTKEVRQYDEEFKKQTVRLYYEQGKSYRILGNELGIPEATIAGWVNSGKYHQGTSSKAVDTEMVAELKRLRAELLDVREERDILKNSQKCEPFPVS